MEYYETVKKLKEVPMRNAIWQRKKNEQWKIVCPKLGGKLHILLVHAYGILERNTED